jgi:hypothetical protein
VFLDSSTGLLTTIFVLYCTPRCILEVIPIRELLDAARRSPRPLAPCSRVSSPAPLES